ncbi:MAG: hypothetical protein R6T89_03985 [Candidatus Syntrophosphaera sp.]
MKATSYEPGKMVVKDEHFDTSSTLTNVKVLPKQRKNLPMLIRRGFEHFDTKNGKITVRVPQSLPGTLTNWKVVRNQRNPPQMHISSGIKHYDTLNSRLNVKVLLDSDHALGRFRTNVLINKDVGVLPQKQELRVESNYSAFIDFTPHEKLLLKHDKEARLLGHFCNLVIRRLALCHSKVEEWKLIVEEYNNGTMAPELFKLRGERKERALRLWVDQYIKSNQDMFALLHKGKNIGSVSKVGVK